VNCGVKGREHNDIHIELGAKLGDDPCRSITAEISPHWRSESWDNLDTYEFSTRVRITGPLFFDASHKPCVLGPSGSVQGRANPARFTNWEIRPVYAIDVWVGGQWIPFHKWVDIPDNESGNE
jgi:hypothetical protein